MTPLLSGLARWSQGIHLPLRARSIRAARFGVIAALVLVFATLLSAQETKIKVQCYKISDADCTKLVARLSEELPKFPVRKWTWVLLDKTGWREFRAKSGATTNSAATLPSERITFVNADWLISASFREYISVIAHEYGHFTCRTKSESEADGCGTRLLAEIGYGWNVSEYLSHLRH